MSAGAVTAVDAQALSLQACRLQLTGAVVVLLCWCSKSDPVIGNGRFFPCYCSK
jgi:hypothetical protein